ncbi:hypothetical protein [Celerinatantimonas sp. YJH-8]|uniref:hypothetical protein n=1 Tax=Celerinatantimonas sp. YJH-8 TaxID=3228714 RepID=UPI0038C739FB
MDREKAIQKRLKLREEHERQYRLNLIVDLTKFLDAQLIPYQIEFGNNVAEWIAENFPIQFSGIDWGNCAGSETIPFVEDDVRDRLIVEAISNDLQVDDIVWIAWGNALRPIMSVRAEVVVLHPAKFADEDLDMWIIQVEKGFCLECYHEGYVGYKRVS